MARLKASSEGKLRTFQKFKTEYCMETYLLDLPKLDHLTAVARLKGNCGTSLPGQGIKSTFF